MKQIDQKNQLDASLSYALNVTANYYRVAAMKLVKEKFPNSLTPEQLGILLILAKKDGLYQKQIADFLSKDRPNITRMLNILEEKGYVERRNDKTNKRILRVFITKKGLEMVEKITPFKDKMNEIALKNISQKELDALCKTLSKVRMNLLEAFDIQL